MRCPHCRSTSTSKRSDRTAHGYRRFRCRECRRGFNERTGPALNRLQSPSDIVFLIVLWQRLCCKVCRRARDDGYVHHCRCYASWSLDC